LAVRNPHRHHCTGRSLEIYLGHDRTQELRQRLLEGQPVAELVRLIQNEWGRMREYKPGSLKTLLYQYSKHVVRPMMVDRVTRFADRRSPGGGTHLQISSLQELSALCEVQRVRVEKCLAAEQKKGAPINPQATEQIRLLTDMLHKLANLQIDVGLLPRAPKTVRGMMLGGDGTPCAFGWTESDEELLRRIKAETQITYENGKDKLN
jgi:hypothetical protein